METRITAIESEIRALKQILAQSDYKALKHADGALTDEEYEETRLERQKLRNNINALEEEMARLSESGISENE